MNQATAALPQEETEFLLLLLLFPSTSWLTGASPSNTQPAPSYFRTFALAALCLDSFPRVLNQWVLFSASHHHPEVPSLHLKEPAVDLLS